MNYYLAIARQYCESTKVFPKHLRLRYLSTHMQVASLYRDSRASATSLLTPLRTRPIDRSTASAMDTSEPSPAVADTPKQEEVPAAKHENENDEMGENEEVRCGAQRGG